MKDAKRTKQAATTADGLRLLTAGELAVRLAVSERMVVKLARSGAVPCVHVGRLLRFRWTEVEARLKGGGPQA